MKSRTFLFISLNLVFFLTCPNIGWAQAPREETEKTAQTDQGNRSGFRVTEELGANRHEEKGDGRIARETQATCQESSIAVATGLWPVVRTQGVDGPQGLATKRLQA